VFNKYATLQIKEWLRVNAKVQMVDAKVQIIWSDVYCIPFLVQF
jgi:hypothetical protein